MNNNILWKHHLNYISELKIHENIFNLRFASNCNLQSCKGECCKWGVYVDIAEKDKILSYTDLICRYMEPYQVHDSLAWFEHNKINDLDFPSGQAVGTQFYDYGCVFLDSSGLCTLQKACISENMNPLKLKPFYCVAYPLTIEGGILMIDEVELKNGSPCPMIKEDGIYTVFDICATELEYVLGIEGVKELYNLSKKL